MKPNRQPEFSQKKTHRYFIMLHLILSKLKLVAYLHHNQQLHLMSVVIDSNRFLSKMAKKRINKELEKPIFY